MKAEINHFLWERKHRQQYMDGKNIFSFITTDFYILVGFVRQFLHWALAMVLKTKPRSGKRFLQFSDLQESNSSLTEVWGQYLNWSKTVKFIGPQQFHIMMHSKALRTSDHSLDSIISEEKFKSDALPPAHKESQTTKIQVT